MVEVEVQLLFRVGGWSDKTKLILISTLVEVVVEVEVELGKNTLNDNLTTTISFCLTVGNYCGEKCSGKKEMLYFWRDI